MNLAVVIPHHRATLDWTEQISLDQARRTLGGYPCYLVHPMGVEPAFDTRGLRRIPLSRRRFRDAASYNRMLTDIRFFRLFRDYEYILIYQLDCLAFAGDLGPWRGVSYVGPPWLKRRRAGGFRHRAVGNGGLSLRHVPDAVAVLRSRSFALLPRTAQGWRYAARWSNLREWVSLGLGAWLARQDGRPAGFHLARRFTRAEDIFWSFLAPQLDRRYRIADPAQALAFGFESRPEWCLAANGGRVPFGCHNWHKNGPEFWPRILEQQAIAASK